MANIPDISKIGGKLDLQKIMDNVKAMLGTETPPPPEAKDNPIGYRLSEITKSLKTVQELGVLQQKEVEKIGAMIGDLYKELAPKPSATKTEATPTEVKAPEPEVKAEVKTETTPTEVKTEEAAKEDVKN